MHPSNTEEAALVVLSRCAWSASAFGHLGRIQLEIVRHVDTRQVHHEGDGLPNLPPGGILETQLELGRIGGDDAEPAPARKAHAGLDQMEQRRIERPEHRTGKPLAGLGKGLRGHLTLEIRGGLEIGGKSVEFLLDAATQTGQHER